MNSVVISAIVILLYFSLGWFHSYKQQKYAWIDFYWVVGVAVIVSTLYILNPGLLGNKQFLLLSSLYLLWSLRLGQHLFSRIRKHDEDPRYVNLINYWGKNSNRNFYILYLVEGLLDMIICLPLFLVAIYGSGELSLFSLVGAALFMVFILGETIADKQLASFKAKYAGQGKVCDVGLWKYSRHPNYFFEILIWFAYGVYIIEISLWGFVPGVIMALLISKVTGVPFAEEQALKTRGELYRKYQQQTSVLIPWFRKKGEL